MRPTTPRPRHLMLALAALASLPAPMTLAAAPASPAEHHGAAAASADPAAGVVERRRETCWRTNRATGQKFRIC